MGDKRIVDWVTKTGRKELIMATLWTENCLASRVIHALGHSYEAERGLRSGMMFGVRSILRCAARFFVHRCRLTQAP
jgi:uncharacterized heparinase superfamily protein